MCYVRYMLGSYGETVGTHLRLVVCCFTMGVCGRSSRGPKPAVEAGDKGSRPWRARDRAVARSLALQGHHVHRRDCWQATWLASRPDPTPPGLLTQAWWGQQARRSGLGRLRAVPRGPLCCYRVPHDWLDSGTTKRSRSQSSLYEINQ